MEYFAKIEEPKKLRVGLMLAAKESIMACSMLENIEEIRQKKLKENVRWDLIKIWIRKNII